ncbi:DUF1405 domain-containing protein [Paenibacillus mendelii]|uniref:DUF1405 domain-containing protein n=1 Tax=Paenibacillus mendelii TaxID=206163 RepID=A0ABV6JGU1_9BACL|nr:DUF1405 domain-containing protein [Paenibacillus mendelii]MCQ6558009.1 DUF1405 domain-containing protein [Paenibacillus mendelii]
MSTLSWFWSRALLMNRSFLWLLFTVNALGTIYGYIWYGDQLIETYEHNPAWQLIFVPDSPTASLFFTLALLYLLFPPKRALTGPAKFLRSAIEALGVVTSIKYGIWAVAMIIAGAMKGSPMVWENYMLIASHLAMAIEALLFTRFFAYGVAAAFGAACWLFLNDMIDYSYYIYPWLPQVLDDILPDVRNFTVGLTLFSFLLTVLAIRLAQRSRSLN